MIRFDTHYQLIPTDEVTQTKVFTFGYRATVGVAGPQKMVNRWLKCFMTRKGSDPLVPNYGTHFADLIGSSVGSPRDVTDAVALFVDDCNRQILKMDSQRLTRPEERLRTGSLDAVIPVSRSSYQIYVTLQSVAGVRAPVELPVIGDKR